MYYQGIMTHIISIKLAQITLNRIKQEITPHQVQLFYCFFKFPCPIRCYICFQHFENLDIVQAVRENFSSVVVYVVEAQVKVF